MMDCVSCLVFRERTKLFDVGNRFEALQKSETIELLYFAVGRAINCIVRIVVLRGRVGR